jgi:hypothetical protein
MMNRYQNVACNFNLRRYTKVAVAGLCGTGEEQSRALAMAAGDQSDALDWMRQGLLGITRDVI